VLRAANATVQIQSRGCGGVLFGSGFPVQRGLVVTNAHVVAGSRRHEVVTNEGVRADATVVYFDPGPRPGPAVGARPLGRAAAPGPAPAQRGQEAVVIGYPGGGPQQVIGASIVLRTQPEAPDIYSRPQGSPPRHLRAPRPGAQGRQRRPGGGPARPAPGVVFAASTVERTEGYALTNAEVRRALDRNDNNRRPVSVGGCAV
jgi:hypothetical protein